MGEYGHLHLSSSTKHNLYQPNLVHGYLNVRMPEKKKRAKRVSFYWREARQATKAKARKRGVLGFRNANPRKTKSGSPKVYRNVKCRSNRVKFTRIRNVISKVKALVENLIFVGSSEERRVMFGKRPESE